MNSLEALERIRNTLKVNPLNDLLFDHHFYDLNVIEADLEVLEIIKNKYVNLYYFKSCLHSPHPHETYNMSERMLTAREFDMIKEWLEREFDMSKEWLENDPN